MDERIKENIIMFLKRVTMKGDEAIAYVEIMRHLEEQGVKKITNKAVDDVSNAKKPENIGKKKSNKEPAKKTDKK